MAATSGLEENTYLDRRIQPKALLFDVFGTCLDWHTAITAALTSHASPKLSSQTTTFTPAQRTLISSTSWSSFAHSWRQAYYTYTRDLSTLSPSKLTSQPLPNNQTGFPKISTFMRTSLSTLLSDHDLSFLYTETELSTLASTWSSLPPWPDVLPGMHALALIPTADNNNLILASLTNADTSMLSSLTTHASLPFSHLFCAESLGAYKTNPHIYRQAVKELGLEAGEVGLVAAHLGDLEAARKEGLRTVYVERRGEEQWGREKVEAARREGWVDVWVGLKEEEEEGGGEEGEKEKKWGFEEVARRLKVMRGVEG